MKTVFTEKELSQIAAHRLTPDAVASQLEDFSRGFPPLPVERPATPGDGILRLDEKGADLFLRLYRDAAPQMRIVKFVPASGAATRMFRNLFEYVRTGTPDASAEKTLAGIENFAFYDIIRNKAAGMDGPATAQAVLDYGARLPKGLIVFHRYPEEVRTAVEEHLTEGAQYAAAGDRVAIHFTVSPEHESGFRELLAVVLPKYEKRFGVKYDIAFSCQDPATDTIAVTPENEPFRTESGSLLFRPAGHGALIGNLGAIDADVIFIKNIDNVTTDRLRGDTIIHKHVLAGILLDVQRKIYNYLAILDRGTDDSVIDNAAAFVRNELFVELPGGFEGLAIERRAEFLREILDRPLRVCAMVVNEGEPGGGPFWVANADGTRSLQIAEPSQIAPEKRHLLAEGTHFNPVDIVCATKNYKGKPFDLQAFTDPSTGFISEKSQDGRVLKALELPGLWNGAMSRWNTVFVEAPASTFTPVKEVNDLLRPQHQP